MAPDPPKSTFRQKSLKDATVQEIELELLLRSRIGDFCGERLISVLLENPTLWEGVICDMLGVNEGGHWLQPASMIKLRDIGHNDWNVDTLYVLCANRADAERLAALIPMEQFGAMVDIKDGEREVDRALGGGEPGAVILRAWWD